MPVLAMVGDQDVPDAAAAAQEMARRLPGLTLRVVAGAAHLPNVERPAEFGAVLRGWLTTTGEDVLDQERGAGPGAMAPGPAPTLSADGRPRTRGPCAHAEHFGATHRPAHP